MYVSTCCYYYIYIIQQNIVFKAVERLHKDYQWHLRYKEFLAIRRAISLNETSFYFVEMTTGETRRIKQIYIDGPSMHHCPRICIFKTGFP